MDEEVEEGSPLSFLGNLRPSERMQSILATYALGSAVGRIAYRKYVNSRTRLAYNVTVGNKDEVYYECMRWLMSNLPEKRRRSLTVHTMYDHTNIPRGERPAPQLLVSYDGRSAQHIEIGGHKVRVSVEKEQQSLSSKIGEGFVVGEKESILFQTRSMEARNAVLDLLQSLLDKKRNEGPRLRISDKWGDWNNVSDMPRRTPESVVLKKGQREAIEDDLQWFLDAEEQYARLGVPWHRGYLFYGPAGTGKTSLAKSLATKFALDCYYIPLSDLDQDTQLINMISNIPPRTLLLMEDIDILHAVKSRDDDHKGLSLSALLNALDGVLTPHGLITIMTTNNKDAIDPALIRPGRADRQEELDLLDDEQLARLVYMMTGETVDLPPLKEPIAPANIIGILTPKGPGDDPVARLRVSLEENLSE